MQPDQLRLHITTNAELRLICSAEPVETGLSVDVSTVVQQHRIWTSKRSTMTVSLAGCAKPLKPENYMGF